MPSRVLETVLTGRNLLSPVLTGAARDVETYDAKVSAASTRATAAADASSKAQATAADRVVAANTRTATSSEAMSAKVAASQKKASESTRAFADVSESSAARTAAAWSSLATKGLPLAAAAVAVVTGKMAADFQTNIVKLETTAGESQKNLGLVSKGLLDMAGQVGVSADTLAKGAYVVESAGFHGRDALLVMKAAAQGAAQEQADLAKVTDAVTTALHDYNLPASDAARVTSEMVTAVSHGKTTFDELTGSLHSVTPLASALHVPLADILGDLAAMTASGESADQATQNMADTLRHLQNPTSQMTGELAQLGITSSNLATDLSSKGLSGTIQEVEKAILDHLDPATQKVLLPAFNQSKNAVQDLNTMLAHMPANLAKLSQGLLDGSVSFKDYRSAVKDLGGQAEVLGSNFLGLFQTSQGFNQQLKNGGPAAQVFSAALQKAMGDSAGLTVALQLTGDHAATVNNSIKDIGKSTGDAAGNIKGWDEVQATFNQKLHETVAAAGSLAIEVGQHVLPVLTTAVGWIGSTAIPGIEHLGSAVGGAVHDFMQLPAPIRDAALALAAFKVAEFLGIIGKLTDGGGRVVGVFRNIGGGAVSMSDQMRTAFSTAKTAQMDMLGQWRSGMPLVVSSTGEVTAQSKLAGTAVQRLSGNLAGLGAAAGEAAKSGLGVLKSAGTGVMNMLGGPWGLTMAGATFAVAEFNHVLDESHAAEAAWTDGLKQGGQAAVAAEQAMKQFGNGWQGFIDFQNSHGQQAESSVLGFLHSIPLIGSELDKLAPSQKQAVQNYNDWYKSLGLLGKAQEDVTQAENNYQYALAHNPAASERVTEAAQRYRDAQQKLANAQNLTNVAEQTHLGLLEQTANQQMGMLNSALAVTGSEQELQQAIDGYNAAAKDSGTTSGQLAQMQNALAQQVYNTASQVGQAAAEQAKANGVTDTASAANQAMLGYLQGVEKQLTGPSKDAVDKMITVLQGATVETGNVADATGKMGLKVVDTWDNNTQVLKSATDDQIKDLQQLGYVVTTLPDGKVVVSSDTGPARAQLEQLIKDYQNRQIAIASGNFGPAAAGVGINPFSHLATGGPVAGPGSGTSDTAGLFALSNGEHVWTAAETAAAGGHAAVESIRANVLAHGRGMAAGGPVFATYPASLSQAAMDQSEALIKKLFPPIPAFSGGGTGAGSPFMRILGQAIAASMGVGNQFGAIDFIFSHESGWNNLAQNPTSSAFGIPQMLDGTWAQYGGKTTNAAQQIKDGILYMENRYGSPNAAAAFWAAHHWYGNGGVVNGAQLVGVGEAGPEAIVPLGNPARRDAVLAQAGLAAPAMPGYGFSAPMATAPTHLTVSFAGGRITGRLELGTDGLVTLVDGRIDAEFGALADSLHYSGS